MGVKHFFSVSFRRMKKVEIFIIVTPYNVLRRPRKLCRPYHDVPGMCTQALYTRF